MNARMQFNLYKKYLLIFLSLMFILTGCERSPTPTATSNPSELTIIPITQVDGTTQSLTQIGIPYHFIAVEEIDGKYTNVSDQVTWHSSDPSIATVNQGQVTGLNEGVINIYAQKNDLPSSHKSKNINNKQSAQSNQIEFMVKNEPLSILQINTDEQDHPHGVLHNQLPINSKQHLNAIATYADNTSFDISNYVNWTSTDANVVSVDSATANMHNRGSAEVSAHFQNEESNIIPFNVSQADLVSIHITPKNSSSAANSHRQFKAIATYADKTVQNITQHASWSTQNSNIATIKAGKAETLAQGQTQITASFNGVSSSASLAVTDAKLVSLQVTPTEHTLNVGEDIFYKAKAVYDDGSTDDVSQYVVWKSSAPENHQIVAAYIRPTTVGQSNITAHFQGINSNNSKLTVVDNQLVELQITPTSISLAQGTQTDMTVMAIYDDGSTKDITEKTTWISTQPDIAYIKHGHISANNVGEATINAVFNNTQSNSASIKVIAPTIEALQITPALESIQVEGQIDYQANATFRDGNETITQDVTHLVAWKTQNTETALISDSKAIGVAQGNTKIIATLNNISQEANLLINNKAITSLQVTPARQTLPVGFVQQYNATAIFDDGSSEDVTQWVNWRTSDSNVATLYSGEVEAVIAGSVTISAEYQGKTSNNASLTVEDVYLQTIKVTPAQQSIPAGTSQDYSALGIYSDNSTQDISEQVNWSSSNTDIATIVYQNNMLNLSNLLQEEPHFFNFAKAQANSNEVGSTQIIAKLDGVESNHAQLDVLSAQLENLQITPQNLSLAKGSSIQYHVIAHYSDGSSSDVTENVSWINSSPHIATVVDGEAVAVNQGETNIQATLNSKTSNRATLNVTQAEVRSIQVTPASETIALGVELQYRALATYSDNSVQDVTEQVTWQSSDNSKLTIVEGAAQTISQGNVKITARIADKISNQAQLIINDKRVNKLQLSSSANQLAKGTSSSLTVKATYTDGTTHEVSDNVQWRLSNNNLASIDAELNSLTATQQGQVELWAVWPADNIESNKITFNITEAILSALHITPLSSELIVNNKMQLKAFGIYSDKSVQELTDDANWISFDTEKATVLQGEVEAFAEGDVEISANYRGVDSENATLKLLKDTLEEIIIQPDNANILLSTSKKFTAIGRYASGKQVDISQDGVTWSLNSIKATVDNTGEVTAVDTKNGIQLTARKNNLNGETISKTINFNTIITVSNNFDIKKIIEERGNTLNINSVINLQAILTLEDGSEQIISNDVSWHENSNSKLVYISKSGRVTARRTQTGEVEISARYQGERSKNTIRLNVIEAGDNPCRIPTISFPFKEKLLTFHCPASKDDFPNNRFIRGNGRKAEKGKIIPLVNYYQARDYCDQKGYRLPHRDELHAFISFVNQDRYSGPNLYTVYAWHIMRNYWSQTPADRNKRFYWTVNMYSHYNWRSGTDDGNDHSVSCVEEAPIAAP